MLEIQTTMGHSDSRFLHLLFLELSHLQATRHISSVAELIALQTFTRPIHRKFLHVYRQMIATVYSGQFSSSRQSSHLAAVDS